MKGQFNHPPAIGRANTVLLVEDTAIITSVSVHALETEGAAELCFKGPGLFQGRVAAHLSEIVLPLVDRITSGLGLGKKRFELSLANLGAASFSDGAIRVAGYSADVPVFLAMLSAGIGVALPQHLVSTGHIASTDGDIRTVEGLETKLDAAARDDSIDTFIYPSLDRDGSMSVLRPAGKKHLEGIVSLAKADLRLVAVSDIAELLKAVISDDRLVLASLENGFFGVDPGDTDHGTPVGRALSFLLENHEARFWSVLERDLLNADNDEVQRLLRAYARFHSGHGRYPHGLGVRLMNLVRSLPPIIHRHKVSFPLLSMSDCLALGRLADEGEHDDLRLLMKAAFGERGPVAPAKPDANPASSLVSESAEALLDHILSLLDSTTLTNLVRPIDDARASYSLDSVVVESHEAFHETITAFHLHLLRHTREIIGAIDRDFIAAEAFNLLEQAYAKQGGYKQALVEAGTGMRGGLRHVLDLMTEQFKHEEQDKHIRQILRTAIDPDDWATKTRIVASIMQRLKGHLPPEILSLPPEQFASKHEEIVMAYVSSQDKLKSLLSSV